MQVLHELYETVLARKEEAAEGSYTGYLFQEGLDKILKKCGEECSEVIIAAKNGDGGLLTEEICDLLYHLLVLMAQQGVSLAVVEDVLKARRKAIGNLKGKHPVDRNS